MDRRTFLKSTGAAVATGGAAAHVGSANAAQNRDGDQITLRTALAPAFANGYLRDRADRLSLRLRELTGGRISLQFFEHGAAGHDVLLSGAGDAYFGTEADHIDRHPGLAFLSALPGDLGLAPEHFAMWLQAGGGQMHWDRITGDIGVKAFAAGHSGRRVGLWSKAPLDLLADLHARSIRVTGMAADVAAHLGMSILGPDNGATADLEEPLLGITAWLARTAPQGEVLHRYWFRDGFNRHGMVLSFGLSSALWQQLEPTLQAAVSAAAAEAYHQALSEHDAHDTGVAPHLLAARGIHKDQLPHDVTRAINHAAIARLDDLVGNDSTVQRIYESYMQFRESVTGLSDPLATARIA